ncbi:NAD(P)H-hydrate dehydratase [Rhodoflexus sp.]
MKILSAQQVREADVYTIQHEPISSLELMERAATAAFHALSRHIADKKLAPRCIHIFCGRGNNGGDGLVIARLLSSSYEVHVWICPVPDVPSPDFIINMRRLEQSDSAKVHTLSPNIPLPELQTEDICIDCIFGSGLNRPPSGFPAAVIAHLNQAQSYKVAIDIPSGLFADKPIPAHAIAFRANYTITFEFPKRCFLYDAYDEFVGEWEVVPIGIHPEFINQVVTKIVRTDHELVREYHMPRKKTAHKGNFGHGLIVAGSIGKMGAAVLAVQAALRSGIGLLTAAIPAAGLPILQVAAPEAMCLPDLGNTVLHRLPDTTNYTNVAIGPGIGQDRITAAAIEEMLKKPILRPMVWDADALNLLAQNRHWWEKIPAGSILTPHPKEFERLIGIAASDFKSHELQLALSIKYNCVILLKGANTCITTPEGFTYFNSTGNPGMATGGSGDVLTGIILALLAQQYTPVQAAVMGAFLHGLAGDLAAAALSQEAMKAGDLIAYLPQAWKQVIK